MRWNRSGHDLVTWTPTATDFSQTAVLVTSASGMAINNRDPQAGGIIRSDHGVQFTPYVLTDRDRDKRSGLLPSMGSTGDRHDIAMIESF